MKIGEKIYILHAFQKKSKQGIKTPQSDVDLIKQPTTPDPSVDRRLLDNLRQVRLSFEVTETYAVGTSHPTNVTN